MVLPFVNVIALFLAIQPAALAFHDSLGFLLAPRARACFFEPFAQPQQPQMQPETKIVDVFVQSGGKANLKLQVDLYKVLFIDFSCNIGVPLLCAHVHRYSGLWGRPR